MDRNGPSIRNPYNFAIFGGICRHFINGSCRFGTRCHYLHEWPVIPSSQICRYYQKGGCWYGEHCRYLHVLQHNGDAARRSSAPHVYSPSVGNVFHNRRGSVPSFPRAQLISNTEHRGSQSMFVNVSNPQHNLHHLTTDVSTQEGSQDHLLQHDADSDVAASPDSARSSEMTRAASSNGSSPETTAAAAGGGGAAASLGDQEEGAASSGDQQETEAFLQSKDVTCGICMDKVYEKMRADERRFGILPNCNHSFCLRCIVTWRKTKDLQEDVVKSCPQCRVKSAFYVPHNYWVEGQAKKTLIATFKEECSKKRCSFFMRHGYCPFKSECIYWHDKGQWPHSHLHQTENIDDLESLIRGLSIAMAFLADGSDDDDDDDDDYYFFI